MVYLNGIYLFLGMDWLGWVFFFTFWIRGDENKTIFHTIYNYRGSSIYLCFRATLTRKLELQQYGYIDGYILCGNC